MKEWGEKRDRGNERKRRVIKVAEGKYVYYSGVKRAGPSGGKRKCCS